MNAAWAIRIDRLEIRLPVGVHPDEIEPQTVWVSLAATGISPAVPVALSDCFDYEPLCHWLTEVWPRSAHAPLLETRINELSAFVFELDERFERVWVGLYKARMSRGASAVGIERSTTRLEYAAQCQDCAGRPTSKVPSNA